MNLLWSDDLKPLEVFFLSRAFFGGVLDSISSREAREVKVLLFEGILLAARAHSLLSEAIFFYCLF